MCELRNSDRVLLDETYQFGFNNSIERVVFLGKGLDKAQVSKISAAGLFYLLSRDLREEQATETIFLGFLEPFTRELSMAYATELNQWMRMEREGSVG